MCGVGCYVQHYHHLTRGRKWGSFLEVRSEAADSYCRNYRREARWARRSRGQFGIFLSSVTEPFPPQERRWGITRRVLQAMVDCPPDSLIVQTHSPQVLDYLDLYRTLKKRCRLRIHISIETDRDRIPGLPPHATPIGKRFLAARQLRLQGIRTVITVSPLLPIRDPVRFMQRAGEAADALVIDHFIEGDGSPDGSRTWRTVLPKQLVKLAPEAVTLDYRDKILGIAQEHFPGRVGCNIKGFAGHYLPESA